MTELIFLIMIASSVTLFSIGGMGFKWVRRFVLPLVLGGCLIWLGVNYIQTVLSMGILCGAMCLGYGEKFGWGAKALVGCSYMLPSLVLGLSWWVLLVPVGFTVVFFLSNFKPTETSFTWRICEAFFGFLISASIISGYLNKW